jgi:hypothetical protein
MSTAYRISLAVLLAAPLCYVASYVVDAVVPKAQGNWPLHIFLGLAIGLICGLTVGRR